MTIIEYAKHRHFSKSHGFGDPWCRPLWLDAALFSVRRWLTLHSPLFAMWCRKVDKVFVDDFDWQRSYTGDTGKDCWIDAYWSGDSPEDAAYSEADHWEA